MVQRLLVNGPQISRSVGSDEHRYSKRLAANDIVDSVGSRGDSYALVESFNGLYKWELIYPQ